MNELQTSNMKTPIEIALGVDENGMTTARALYEFLSGEKSHFANRDAWRLIEIFECGAPKSSPSANLYS